MRALPTRPLAARELSARPSTRSATGASFGAGQGYVTTAFYNPSSVSSPATAYSKTIQIQSNGKIVVAGGASTTSGFGELGVVRYNADGSLDTSFGNGGIALNASLDYFTYGQMMVIDGAGRIDVVGPIYADRFPSEHCTVYRPRPGYPPSCCHHASRR
jgi:hypothetical protein